MLLVQWHVQRVLLPSCHARVVPVAVHCVSAESMCSSCHKSACDAGHLSLTAGPAYLDICKDVSLDSGSLFQEVHNGVFNFL